MAKKRRVKLQTIEPKNGVFTMKIFLFLGIFALLAITYVWLNSQVNEIGKQLDKEEAGLRRGLNELQNLEAKLETFTERSFIEKQCRRFNLSLRPAKPGQVRYMTLYPKKEKKKENIFVSLKE